MAEAGRPVRTILRRGFALILLLAGLALAWGGAQLAWLGGSLYYLPAGLAMVASAVLAWRGDARAGRLYALFLAATLAWAVWEVGFSGWLLLPRLLVPFVLGVGFLSTRTSARTALRCGGVLVAGLVVGAGVHALGPGAPADPMYQTGIGPAPLARISTPAAGDWLHYGNDQGGSRFSPLDQLTPANVGKLEKVWEAHVGFGPHGAKSALEVSPLKVGDTLYLCTGFNDVIALDAETGRQKWRHNAGSNITGVMASVCRGVAYYRVPAATGLCAERIITNTVDARLIALDAASGRPCPGFGTNGQTSLLTGMGDVIKGYYFVTSAPTVVRGKVVLGGWVSDGQFWGEPSGVIRAFDAVTGKFAWAFDMGRPDDHREPAPGSHYTRATPNSWAPMSADETLGLVYAPTGNATPDYFGAQRRPFDDRYASSVVAIDAETGGVRWSFQTTHHDLWDYDVASQPTLVDLPAPGGIRRALLQPTKRGEIFLLDRISGKPLATVEERRAPQAGHAPGERLSPTQPFSAGLPSFSGPKLREADMWGVSPFDQLWCRIRFKEARYDGPLTPPGLTPSVVSPGYLGGVDWGGVSVDRDRAIMVVNANRVPNYDLLLTRGEADARGVKPIARGSGGDVGGPTAQAGTPYAAWIQPFLSPLVMPCTAPPYGMIAAVDLVSRKLIWARPLGTGQDAGPLAFRSRVPLPIGVPNNGGSMATRGGLVFIGATQEHNIRAYDIRTGREVWNARLPAGGQATPVSYWSARSKRQFVVIAAGGNMALLSKAGDSIVAFALPR